VRARQRLEHVVMRVDEARRDDMARGVEDRLDRRGGRSAARDQFNDPAVFDDESAAGIVGENGERVLDPDAHVGLPFSLPV
jgi:hypothetical protein